ncbi:MAG: sulfatase-like hydrolase/transferase, partial [Deltaproteobacteria bacterium]|nr:sulfatase-like hydrolase/transferase [Deltaproteobacteria bacterium]
MKTILPSILVAFACHSLLAQPNVILIVCDDAGYADFGFMNPVTGTTTKMLTPELDTLRAQGTLFTKTYTGTVCSPSRGSILTGSYGQRVGYEHNINNHLGANDGPEGFAHEDVIAFERMKQISGANYKTLAIGKWHVGAQADTLSGGSVTVPGNRPPRQGVDHFFGLLGGSRPYATPMAADQISREVKLLREISPGATATDPANNSNEEDSGNWDGDITDAFGKRAREYVTAHANQSYPFFLYVAFTAPHGPLEQSADYAALSNPSHPNYTNFTSMSDDRKKYYSMLYTMDRNVGLLMDRLEDPNNDGNTSDSIVDNTLVIFINDNGGATSSNTGLNLPLRGQKGAVYDGGCRVPMLMVGPNIPVNASFDKPVHSMDIVPTMIGAGGNTIPAELMGTNLIPYITGADSSDPHEYVIVRAVNKFGLRKGNYKLILEADGDQFLYDTSTDIG